MIGGEDAVIKTFNIDRSLVLDVCLRNVLRYWRQSIVQSGASAVVYNHYGMIPFDKETELMVYRDKESFELWDEFGALPINRNTMVHLLAFSNERVTVVSDDWQATEMKRLLRGIRQAIIDIKALVERAEKAS